MDCGFGFLGGVGYLTKNFPIKKGKLRPIFEFYFLAFGRGSSDLDGGEPEPDVQDPKLIDRSGLWVQRFGWLWLSDRKSLHQKGENYGHFLNLTCWPSEGAVVMEIRGSLVQTCKITSSSTMVPVPGVFSFLLLVTDRGQ